MLSKTCGYAIRGILYVAVKNETNKTVGIKDMAEALEVPQPFLGKIMQELVRREILSSVKGPNGGFFVHERTLETPIIKVVEAIDGLGAFQKCALGLNKCSSEQPCPLHDEIKDYRNALLTTLTEKSIGDLRDDLVLGKVFVKN